MISTLYTYLNLELNAILKELEPIKKLFLKNSVDILYDNTITYNIYSSIQ